jgi:hypothetical protein
LRQKTGASAHDAVDPAVFFEKPEARSTRLNEPAVFAFGLSTILTGNPAFIISESCSTALSVHVGSLSDPT